VELIRTKSEEYRNKHLKEDSKSYMSERNSLLVEETGITRKGMERQLSGSSYKSNVIR
jgi:hypothetical protein